MAAAPDEMTPDKAVRYACRALTEERDSAVFERNRLAGLIPGLMPHDSQYRTYLESEMERERVHMENLDAAMRALNGLVGR